MSPANPQRPPVWFWVLAVLATAWNAAGIWGYISHVSMSAETLAALPPAEQALYADTPAWANGAFAVAVFAGFLGSLTLLLRSRWALVLLSVSLAAVLVQMGHAFLLTNALEVLGPQSLIGPVIVIVVAIGLVFLARAARGRGWLR